MSLSISCFLLVFLCTQRIAWCQQCPDSKTNISLCVTDNRVGALEFKVSMADAKKLICPRADTGVKQWRVIMLDGNGDAITSGLFCSTEPYNSSQVCMDINSTLRVHHEELASNIGMFEVEFVSSALSDSRTIINIRYAPTGVYPFNESMIEVEEGTETVQLMFIIYSQPSPAITASFNNMKFSDGLVPSQLCAMSASSEFTNLHIVQIANPTVTSSGIYTLFAEINKGMFNASITLIVNALPNSSPVLSPSSVPNPSLSVLATPTLNSSSSSRPLPPSNTSSALPTLGYVGIGVLVFFIVVIVIILIVVFGFCVHYCKRWKKKQRRLLPPEGMKVSPPPTTANNGSPSVKNMSSIPRLGSTSSERPLTQGESSSSINTPTSENYTAVYCSSQYSKCGQIMTDKHGDRIRIVDNWEEVRSALINPCCTDILLLCDPDDGVFREMMCCGVDPSRPSTREKLRIIKFVTEDNYPENTVGVNGYRFVLVDGPPDLNTLLMAINKAEYPELVQESHHHQNQPREEVDLPYTPLLQEQKETNKLLRVLVDKKNESNKTDKKILEETQTNTNLSRDRNAILTELQGNMETVITTETNM